MCESDMVTLRRAEAQVEYWNCAESALTIHVYFTHCASARGRALRKNKVRLGIHLRREWDCGILQLNMYFIIAPLAHCSYTWRYEMIHAWVKWK